MYSQVYGQVIKYCENHDDSFITQTIDLKLHNKSTKPLNEGSSQAAKYVSALSKLFRQIPINQNNLWIIPTIGTQSIRIYFSDPIIYPMSICCQKCVYIDMETNLNGSIVCPSCNMVLVSFIHYWENQHNQFDDFQQVDKCALFKEKKKQNQMRNRLMHENLTSNKFKTKNLKKVLKNHFKLTDNSFKTNNIGESFSQTKENNFFNPIKPLDRQKDGFILQIKTLSTKDKQNLHYLTKQKYYSKSYEIKNGENESNFDEKTKREFQHQLSIEETKKIINDIFK